MSLQTRKGQYSEVMIRGNNGSSIVRLMLDPFSRILYSTQADEFSRVNNYVSQGKSMIEAISLVAHEKFGKELAA